MQCDSSVSPLRFCKHTRYNETLGSCIREMFVVMPEGCQALISSSKVFAPVEVTFPLSDPLESRLASVTNDAGLMSAAAGRSAHPFLASLSMDRPHALTADETHYHRRIRRYDMQAICIGSTMLRDPTFDYPFSFLLTLSPPANLGHRLHHGTT